MLSSDLVTRSSADQHHELPLGHPRPFGNSDQIDWDKIRVVYYALMRSIGRVGTEANFQANCKAMEHICRALSQRCITDLSDKWSDERAKLIGGMINAGSFNTRHL